MKKDMNRSARFLSVLLSSAMAVALVFSPSPIENLAENRAINLVAEISHNKSVCEAGNTSSPQGSLKSQ
jgi:hypothetical protein